MHRLTLSDAEPVRKFFADVTYLKACGREKLSTINPWTGAGMVNPAQP